MMRVRDTYAVVHVAQTSPGRNPDGRGRCGVTSCGRWYAWESMKTTFNVHKDIDLATHSTDAVTCLWCAR